MSADVNSSIIQLDPFKQMLLPLHDNCSLLILARAITYYSIWIVGHWRKMNEDILILYIVAL